jgi:WD domain, G-beta repeat
LELEQFDEGQIRQVLGRRTDAETVELIVGNEVLVDLARRPVMGQLLVTALADLQVDLRTGVEVNVARVYYYAMRRKMEQDIKTERTFTSLADKTYFLCELAWEMLSLDRLTLNFREFPDRLRSMFGLQDKDIDHWCYDMMGNSLLIRDGDGNYKFAHKSLVEFFVAYKFAAELGLLHKDFWGLMVGMGTEDARTWSEYCGLLACPEERERFRAGEFVGFRQKSEEQLVITFGKMLLTKVVIDLLLPFLDLEVKYRQSNVLLELMQWTSGRSFNCVGYLGGNAGNLLLSKYSYALEYQDFAGAVLPGLDLRGVGLKDIDLTNTDLSQALVTTSFSRCLVIAVSPNGDWFVTGHEDGDIRMWHVVSGRELRIFAEHNDSITCLLISNDEYWLFSASSDGEIKKWNTKTGECIFTFRGDEGWVTLALSRNGRWLFSSSNDGEIKKWNTKTGECVLTFSNQAAIMAMIMSEDGNWLFSASDDGIVRKWDAANGDFIFTFGDVKNGDLVLFLALSNDGKYLFSGDEVAKVDKWNVNTGECINTFSIDDGWLTSFTLSRNGCWLFSGIYNGSVKRLYRTCYVKLMTKMPR